MAAKNAMDRLRARLNFWLDDRIDRAKIRHKALARELGKSESWLSNVLSGKRGLRIVDLDKIAEFFHVPVSELTREIDTELIEVTPTEKALLRKMRLKDQSFRDAVLRIAEVRVPESPKPPKRMRAKKAPAVTDQTTESDGE